MTSTSASGRGTNESVIDGTGLPRVIDLADQTINVAINGVSVKGRHVFDEGTRARRFRSPTACSISPPPSANSFYFATAADTSSTSRTTRHRDGLQRAVRAVRRRYVHLTYNHSPALAGRLQTGDDNNVPLVFNLNKATGFGRGQHFDHVGHFGVWSRALGSAGRSTTTRSSTCIA